MSNWRDVTSLMFRSASMFWISPMARSLPGMTREEKITVSSAPSFTEGWSPRAIRASAEGAAAVPCVGTAGPPRQGVPICR